MNSRTLNIFYILIILFISFSCSTTRSLESGEYLYTGSKINFDSTANDEQADILYPKMQELLAPPTNRELLGVPVRLYWYNFFHGPKDKGLGKWMQGLLGEEPVLYDEEITDKVSQLMSNRLFNNGYFWPSVVTQVDSSRKKATVNYNISPGNQYTINSFSYDVSDTSLSKVLAPMYSGSIIKPGQPYNLNDLRRERERISSRLKELGYFYFEPDYLKFAADTTMGTHAVDVRMQLKQNAPKENLRPLFINEIIVYTDYQIGRPPGAKTTHFEGIDFVHDELDIRPTRIREIVFFNKGDKYNPRKHQTTLRRLSNLAYYKFVSLRHERDEATSNQLNVKIYLTPKRLNTLEGSVGLALISNQYIGPEISLGYTNRNIFRGLEQLRLEATGDFNFPLREDAGNYFESITATASITRPGLGIPFVSSKILPSLIQANTRVQFSYERERIRLELSNDQEFLDNLLFFGFENLLNEIEDDPNFAPPISVENYELSFGYIWKRQPLIQSELNPLRFTFQNVTYGNSDLKPLLEFIFSFESQEDQLLNLERMFIIQPDYIFTYDTREGPRRRNNLFYRGRLSIAGNKILEDEQTAIAEENLENVILQVENDVRLYLQVSPSQVLASRFIANVAYPFSDRVIFSITDLYSVGGPNSVRAFYPRTIGPGTTLVGSGGGGFGALQGKGDIKLEGSIEFRQKFNSYLELAVFADAGNVWRIEKDVEDSPTSFNFDTFYNEIALGTGIGLRLDFSYLVFRVDLAFPLTKPFLPEGERWVGNQISLGDPEWRRENLVLNLAFGYPF